MIRLGTFTATLGLAAIIAAHAQAAEGVLTETRHVLSADLAVEAAQAAIASCKAQGWNITASIIDRSGAMKILLAGDGAGGVGRESARRKAYTSALLGVSTDEFGKRLAGAASTRRFTTRRWCRTPAACRSSSATKSSEALARPARRAATRTKPAPKPASPRSPTG